MRAQEAEVASAPHLDLHFSQVGQLLEDPSGLQDGDVVVIQSPTREARRSLHYSPATLPHTALAELCLNFTFSRVQETYEKLQYEVRGLAGRDGWEKAGRHEV